MDSRQVAAHERAGELNQSEGGITFVGPEPDDMPTPNLMLLATALVGLLSLFVIAGLFGWLAYWVWPVLVASI